MKPQLALVRLATLGTVVLRHPRSSELVQAYRHKQQLERAYSESVESFCSEIQREVGAIGLTALGKDILRLRRQIKSHNYGENTPKDAVKRSEFWIAASSTYENLLREKERLERARSSFQEAYDQASDAARANVRLIASARELNLALAMTAPTALQGVRLLQESTPDTDNARTRYIERSVLRFIARSSAKTSPLSFFCGIGLAHVGTVKHRKSTESAGSKPLRLRSSVRLNKSILRVIRDALLNCPQSRMNIPIAVSSSWFQSDNVRTYLTQDDDVERFHAISWGNDLAEVLAMASELTDLSVGSLARALAEHDQMETSLEAAVTYVEGLIKLGVLRYAFRIEDLDSDWLDTAKHLLEHVATPLSFSLKEGLEQLDSSCRGIEAAEPLERQSYLTGAEERALRMVSQTADRSSLRVENVFFEDVAIVQSEQERPVFDIARPLEVVARIFQSVRHLAWPLNEQDALAEFHLQVFAGETVPLLEFYAAFCKSGEVQVAKGDPFTATSVLGERLKQYASPKRIRRKDAIERVKGLFASAAVQSGCGTVAVSLNQLEAAAEFDPALAYHHPSSGSAFVLPYSRGKNFCPTSLVLSKPTAFTGFGKYTSRFDGLVEPDLLRATRHIPDSNPSILFAEIAHCSDFNANLHKPILENSIVLPTDEPYRRRHGTIECNDLVVERCQSDFQRIRLIDRTSGREVIPVDTGFLNSRMRPPIFQFLLLFQPGASINIPLGEAGDVRESYRLGRSMGGDPTTVTKRPRIEVGADVVVRRRQWQLPIDAFAPLPRERPVERYLRYLDLLGEIGCPTQAFVRTSRARHSSPVPASGRINRQAFQSLRKPIFVDFESPSFAELVASTATFGAHMDLVLEESLPVPSDGVIFGGTPHRAELVCEFQL